MALSGLTANTTPHSPPALRWGSGSRPTMASKSASTP